MSTNEMSAIIKELKEYKALKEEAEARISELEMIVKSELRANDTNRMVFGAYTCTLSTCNTTRIDSKELQRVHPDIFGHFSKISSYERLTIR